MELTAKEQQFMELMKEQNAYKEALTALQWDSHTQMPPGGVDSRAEVTGILSGKLQELETSERMADLIGEMKAVSHNRLILQAAEECGRVYERSRKIPNDRYRQYVTLCSKSEAVWQEARLKDDYRLFEPYLREIVEFNREFADRWGYEGHRYNALLGSYEPGVTAAMLDDVFPALRKSLAGLIRRVQDSPVQADVSLLKTPFPVERQEALCHAVLERIGYRFSDGRLDTSAHPYSFAINQHDVRLSTKYTEDDFRMGLFSAIHEGGHALYEQNIAPQLRGTPLSAASSMGMHESQSLYWEVFTAGDRAFWETNYGWFRELAPAHFDSVPLDDFYLALHDVRPSLIRIEADPLTYPMHIIMRYEIEKGLLSGDLETAELPGVWNSMMESYLGITPPTYRDGVLQDIHWSSGDFGYFPSYALGYLYAAQLHQAMKIEVDFEGSLRTGEFRAIRQWFTDHIHLHGKTKPPLDLLRDATEEDLNPQYLVDYLTAKYGEIYEL